MGAGIGTGRSGDGDRDRESQTGTGIGTEPATVAPIPGHSQPSRVVLAQSGLAPAQESPSIVTLLPEPALRCDSSLPNSETEPKSGAETPEVRRKC